MKWGRAVLVTAVVLVGAWMSSVWVTSHGREVALQSSVKLGFFEAGTGQQKQSGSGVVIRENATHYYILTAKHVALSIPDKGHWKAQNFDGYTVGMPQLFVVDSKNDLAILRIHKNNTYAPVGVSYICRSDSKVFDEVYAIGEALSREIVVTRGIIGNTKALGSVWHERFKTAPELIPEAKLIPHYAHDAFILPGSSGGGLFDSDTGCLVGINISVAVLPSFFSVQVLGNKGYAITRADVVDFLRRAFP